MPFDRRLASRRTFLQSVCLGSAATGLRIGQANAQDTPAATQNSLPPVPGKQLPVRIRGWAIAPCPITNYGMEPVFYYQPQADPQRWYEVRLYNCDINEMGIFETVPLVKTVPSQLQSTITPTFLKDFQLQMVGVQNVKVNGGAVGNPDTSESMWYRLARFSVNGKEYAHRLFVNPPSKDPAIDTFTISQYLNQTDYLYSVGITPVQRCFRPYISRDTHGREYRFRLQQPS